MAGWFFAPESEKTIVHQCLIESSDAHSLKKGFGFRDVPLTGYQNFGAGGSFWIWQFAVFLHDQIAAQRYHEKHADSAADNGNNCYFEL
jgi:hypothetical protein